MESNFKTGYIYILVTPDKIRRSPPRSHG